MPYKSISAVVASANNVVNPTTLTPVLPARATGDLLLAITSCRSITATVATPAGWTIWPGFPKRSTTASGGSIYIFYRAVDGGESNPALIWTGVATATSGDSSQAIVLCLDGQEIASPSDVTPPAATDASAAGPSIPTLTTASTDALVVGAAMKVIDVAVTGTIANSFTERGDFHTTTGTGHQLYVATRQMTAPAATGASAITENPTTAARCLAVAIAVKERLPVTYFGALSLPTTFGAVTAGDATTPAVTHYGATSMALAFDATTAAVRKALGVVAHPMVFAAATQALRRTFAQIARATTFGAVTAGHRPAATYFGATAAATSFGAVTAGQRIAAPQIAVAPASLTFNYEIP